MVGVGRVLWSCKGGMIPFCERNLMWRGQHVVFLVSFHLDFSTKFPAMRQSYLLFGKIWKFVLEIQNVFSFHKL